MEFFITVQNAVSVIHHVVTAYQRLSSLTKQIWFAVDFQFRILRFLYSGHLIPYVFVVLQDTLAWSRPKVSPALVSVLLNMCLKAWWLRLGNLRTFQLATITSKRLLFFSCRICARVSSNDTMNGTINREGWVGPKHQTQEWDPRNDDTPSGTPSSLATLNNYHISEAITVTPQTATVSFL